MNKTKLIEYLDEASIQYYSGTPIISDEEFDHLVDATGYSTIGAKQHEDTCKHAFPMYSLQKHYEDEGKRPLEGYDCIPSLKLDGAAVSLLYIDGKLLQVLTRGDGTEGRDITNKFISRKNLVPLEIACTRLLQVTGEIVAPKHIENSRNYAAGALNLKNNDEFCLKAISFFAYGVAPFQRETYREDMNLLEGLGFETVCTPELDLIYECDGMVHRVNSNKLFTELGYTAKHPKGAFALKVRKEAVETELIGVEWNVGRTGKVVPTAILKPVYIGDKLVSRATLNNPGFIEMLDLQIGCTVGIILGGEIIPRVLYRVE